MVRVMLYSAAFLYMGMMCGRPVNLEYPISMHWPQAVVIMALIVGELWDRWRNRGKDRKIYGKRLVVYVIAFWIMGTVSIQAYWVGDSLWFFWMLIGLMMLGLGEVAYWLRKRARGRKESEKET